MELTKNEIEIAERYLSKREKQIAQWPRKRWLILVIFSVIMFIGYRAVNDGMRDINDDKTADSDVSRVIKEAPSPELEQRWVIGTMIKIAKVLEARHQVVTHALLQVALGYIQLLMGMSMVCLTILRWNTGERDALICKLLREKLQKLQSPDSLRMPVSSVI